MIESLVSECATLRIHWPEQGAGLAVPTNGDMAHRLAAKACAAAQDDSRCQVSPAVFHHRLSVDGSCQPLTGLSAFRYHGGKKSMRVVAVGYDAVDLLDREGHRLTRAISRFVGQPLRESWTHDRVSLRQHRSLRSYYIPYMVASRAPLRKLPVGSDLLARQMTPDVKAWAGRIILDGILRQAALLGLPDPEDEPLLRVQDIEGALGYLRQGHYYGSALKGVTFTTELALVGAWSVGRLCLLGEGVILPARQPVATAVAA